MPTTKVSILMPVKNAGGYLKDCVDSILSQSLVDWELIAVDDHSDDGSLHVLEEYSQTDQRITVRPNTGHGIISALNVAYIHSTGRYITRMDADDIMIPDKLQLMSLQLRSSGPAHIVVGQVKYFSDEVLGDGYKRYATWLNALTKLSNNFNDIYKECTIPSPCWMVHRSDLDRAGAFNCDRYPEDYDLAFRFKKIGLKISPVQTVLHLWRDHPERTSRNHEHYADNRFFSLKVDHFLDQDYMLDRDLILWGAGRKGKLIARQLKEKNVSFRWLSNNIMKIGKTIYGVVIETDNVLESLREGQVVVAISGRGDQDRISEVIDSAIGLSFYRFC